MNNASTSIQVLLAIFDSYKIGMTQLHDRKFTDPAGKECHTRITSSYSNITPRKNCYMRFSKLSDQKLTVWGTRYTFAYVIDLFNRVFFSRQWDEVEAEMMEILAVHFGNEGQDQKEFMDGLKSLHVLGHLPIEVRALKEGTRVNTGIPVVTVRARDGFGWVVNAIESVTSNLVFPMINTATIIEQFYIQASQAAVRSIPEEMVQFWLPYCIHEFGFRGMFGPEHGLAAASCHSLFFQGSDTIGVIPWMKEIYDHAIRSPRPAAVSVRALEHADVTRMISEYIARGFTKDPELHVMRELATNSTGILSYVADSENYYRVLTVYGPMLRDVIMNRKPRSDGQPARFVFRPDSSRKSPLEIICGYDVVAVDDLEEITPKTWSDDTAFRTPDGKINTWVRDHWEEISEEEAAGSLEALWKSFGGTTYNNFRIINPAVGLIYGEAINVEMQERIYRTMEAKGFSSFNILMGKGSYATLENNTRDMLSITYKQTFSTADFVDLNLTDVDLVQQKNPMGASYKKSAAGLLRVDYDERGEIVLFQNQTEESYKGGLLEVLVDQGTLITEGNTFMDAINVHTGFFAKFQQELNEEEAVLSFLQANTGK